MSVCNYNKGGRAKLDAFAGQIGLRL